MIVDAACYQLGQRVPGEFDYEEAGRLITESDTFAWVGLHEPSPEEFEKAVKTFNLHELAVDDALKAHQRPKLETFDETLFVVTKPARYADPVEIVEFGEILIFVDPNFVVAVRHGEASRLIEARHKLEADPGAARLRVRLGPPRHPQSGGEGLRRGPRRAGSRHSGHRG